LAALDIMMKEDETSLKYQEIGPAELDVIRPLWEKLKAHHVPLSPHFAIRRAARTFDARKQELMAKASGMLRVDLAYAGAQQAPVAYCVTSVTPDGTGEIDSLFVEQDYRGYGIGTALTRRALAWLDGHNAVAKVVLVAFGNDAAIEFYARFGFVADNVSLRQISDSGCQPTAPPNGGPAMRFGNSGAGGGPPSVS
jgi:ribosomal protein S18 acetylase RimI-like enzyme